MTLAWYIAPYIHTKTDRIYGRHCSMDSFTSQIMGSILSGPKADWSELEIGGDEAIVKVNATPEILTILDLQFYRLPKVWLDDPLSDLKLLEQSALVDQLRKQYSTAEIEDSLGKDLKQRTFGDVLRFMARLVRKPRIDTVADKIQLDGIWRPCPKTIEQLNLEVGNITGAWGTEGPSTPILDNFNRANAGPPPSASWSNPIINGDAGIKVVSNQCAMNGSFADGYWNTLVGPDCEIHFTIAAVERNIAFIRITNPNSAGATDGYMTRISGGENQCDAFRIDNDIETQLGAAISQGVAAGDKMGIQMVGSTLDVEFKDGAASWGVIGTRTDATYSAAGYIGLGAVGSTAIAEDFGGGTITVGQPYPLRLQGVSTMAGFRRMGGWN